MILYCSESTYKQSGCLDRYLSIPAYYSTHTVASENSTATTTLGVRVNFLRKKHPTVVQTSFKPPAVSLVKTKQ